MQNVQFGAHGGGVGSMFLVAARFRRGEFFSQNAGIAALQAKSHNFALAWWPETSAFAYLIASP
jgi:hypothetical protein